MFSRIERTMLLSSNLIKAVIIIKLLPEVIYDEYQLILFVEACRISSKRARTQELPDEPDRRC